jgi:hypothetical protein
MGVPDSMLGKERLAFGLEATALMKFSSYIVVDIRYDRAGAPASKRGAHRHGPRTYPGLPHLGCSTDSPNCEENSRNRKIILKGLLRQATVGELPSTYRCNAGSLTHVSADTYSSTSRGPFDRWHISGAKALGDREMRPTTSPLRPRTKDTLRAQFSLYVNPGRI